MMEQTKCLNRGDFVSTMSGGWNVRSAVRNLTTIRAPLEGKFQSSLSRCEGGSTEAREPHVDSDFIPSAPEMGKNPVFPILVLE